MNPKVFIRRCDDWAKCIIDGQVVDEGHNIRIYHILEHLSDLGIIDYQCEYNDADPEETDLTSWFEEMTQGDKGE